MRDVCAHVCASLTLLEAPAALAGSSYAATFSQVATTACVGAKLASGKPRCTSWTHGWMDEQMAGRAEQ